jgi:hypothetical protein
LEPEDHCHVYQGVSPLSLETVIAQDSFMPTVIEAVDCPTEYRPESNYATPNSPLREALAAFNDIFSSTFSSPTKKSDTTKTFRLPLRLPSPIPTGVSISNAFNSISQLTGDIAASIAAGYESGYLDQGQYHEDAVARDVRFHWEEEMRCLEVQCGL